MGKLGDHLTSQLENGFHEWGGNEMECFMMKPGYLLPIEIIKYAPVINSIRMVKSNTSLGGRPVPLVVSRIIQMLLSHGIK